MSRTNGNSQCVVGMDRFSGEKPSQNGQQLPKQNDPKGGIKTKEQR